jgi:hypothetical protein
MFADCGRGCRAAVRREVAQYHVISNVGIAVEFLAREGPFGSRDGSAHVVTRLARGPILSSRKHKRIPDLLRPDPPAPTGETPRPPLPVGTASPE